MAVQDEQVKKENHLLLFRDSLNIILVTTKKHRLGVFLWYNLSMLENKNKFSGGYAGIIALLIVFTIIAFLIVKPSIFGGKTVDEKGNIIETKGSLETGLDAVNKAKDVKKAVEAEPAIPKELLEQ